MKRILAVLLACVALLGLVACGGKKTIDTSISALTFKGQEVAIGTFYGTVKSVEKAADAYEANGGSSYGEWYDFTIEMYNSKRVDDKTVSFDKTTISGKIYNAEDSTSVMISATVSIYGNEQVKANDVSVTSGEGNIVCLDSVVYYDLNLETISESRQYVSETHRAYDTADFLLFDVMDVLEGLNIVCDLEDRIDAIIENNDVDNVVLFTGEDGFCFTSRISSSGYTRYAQNVYDVVEGTSIISHYANYDDTSSTVTNIVDNEKVTTVTRSIRKVDFKKTSRGEKVKAPKNIELYK